RPCVGALQERPLRRGTRAFEARASARHARRPDDLPPRDDRALSRPPVQRPRVAQPGTPDQSALLPALCAGRARGAQMRRILVAFAVLAAALLVPASASAHPLGNFTVNRFTAVELSGRDVYVHYVLDLAEIPTVQD